MPTANIIITRDGKNPNCFGPARPVIKNFILGPFGSKKDLFDKFDVLAFDLSIQVKIKSFLSV